LRNPSGPAAGNDDASISDYSYYHPTALLNDHPAAFDTCHMLPTVARAESRRPTDSAWNRRLTQLSERLQRSGESPDKLGLAKE
jgi:hypothetical protein